MTTLVLWSIFCFFLGGASFAFYKSSGYRVLPPKGELEINAFFSHTLIQDGENTTQSDQSLVLSLKNTGDSDIRLEAWFIRSLGISGFLHQFYLAPQNLVTTLAAGEKTSVEVQDLSFLETEKLHTLVVRDVYGREWELQGEQVKTLKKNYFWDSL